MINFAETYVGYPDGQQNVGQPPDAVLANGFIPETAGARGQPLPAQWLNWLFQKAFRLGEADLPTRLRIEFEATEAERQLARARIDLAAAISAQRQALGLLPE